MEREVTLGMAWVGWGHLGVGRAWSWSPRVSPGSSSLGFTSSPSPFSSSSPENVEDSGLDSPSHAAPGPFPDSWVLRPGTPQSPPACRPQPPESRGALSLLPSDSPLPLAASPGPWGLEAVAGGGESRSGSREGSCGRREHLPSVLGAELRGRLAETSPWQGQQRDGLTRQEVAGEGSQGQGPLSGGTAEL